MAIGLYDDLVTYGEALIDRGLSVRGAIEGIGIVLNGLVWTRQNVWVGSDNSALSTVWTNSDAAITTTWTNSDSSISTIWTPTPEGEN